jgi:hypothetical protein
LFQVFELFKFRIPVSGSEVGGWSGCWGRCRLGSGGGFGWRWSGDMCTYTGIIGVCGVKCGRGEDEGLLEKIVFVSGDSSFNSKQISFDAK